MLDSEDAGLTVELDSEVGLTVELDSEDRGSTVEVGSEDAGLTVELDSEDMELTVELESEDVGLTVELKSEVVGSAVEIDSEDVGVAVRELSVPNDDDVLLASTLGLNDVTSLEELTVLDVDVVDDVVLDMELLEDVRETPSQVPVTDGTESAPLPMATRLVPQLAAWARCRLRLS